MKGATPAEGVRGIRGGRVLTPGGFVEADLRIDEEGRIEAVERGACEGLPETQVVDARGLEVRPGAIDVHVHLLEKQGRYRSAEDASLLARAALENGVTTIAIFATAPRGGSIREAVRAREAQMREEAGRIHWTLHLTPRRWTARTFEDLELLARQGLRRVKLYTTYRRQGLQVSYRRMGTILRRLAAMDFTVLVHCEDPAVLERADAGVPGVAGPGDHPRLRPPEAEVEAAGRVAALALATGCRVHVVHVSHPDTVDVLVRFREMGAPLTWETALHYLVFDEGSYRGEHGGELLCTPPFRSPEAREGLFRRLREGRIDMLASDHCPFVVADKAGGDPRRAAMGIPGVGALGTVAVEWLERQAGVAPEQVHRWISEEPARLLGLWPQKGAIRPGADADLVLWERLERPERAWSTLAPVADPWRHFPLTRRPRLVIRGQSPVYID